MKLFLTVFTVLALISPAMACIVPENNMLIMKDTKLCTGVYYVPEGLHLKADNITLDCAGSVLKGDFKGRGVWIEHVSGVVVENCHVVNFRIGIYARNSSKIFLCENHLVRNLEGVRLVDVHNSTVWSVDVSLKKPLTVLESVNNYISFVNRRISESVCGENFCNVWRSVIEKRLQEKPKPWFKNWLFSMLA